jgi:NAD(P)-dependent dehydrogenase (short-subunit alcohol dehydrogenase family)
MNAGLRYRRFFITGAARGIGLACVSRLVESGANVGAFDRDAEALAGLESRFPAGSVSTYPGDVASSAALGAAIERFAAERGGLDGLICSAGIDLLKPLEDTSDEAWRTVFSVNLDGCMHACRAAIPHLRKADGGTIVNVSSGAGLQPLKFRTAYSASKAALQMFSKALAMEAADFGIRVNAVCPGAVETDLLRESIDGTDDPAAARETVRQRYALGRIADPDEIASAILWLSSRESSYVTGVALAVDGGRTFH